MSTPVKLHASSDDSQTPKGEQEGADANFSDTIDDAPAVKAAKPKRTRKNKTPAAPDGFVKVRITKLGNDKVHTGAGAGKTFAWKDTPNLPRASAEALELKGWCEIDG